MHNVLSFLLMSLISIDSVLPCFLYKQRPGPLQLGSDEESGKFMPC